MRRQIRGLQLGLFAALGYLPAFALHACGDDTDLPTTTGGRSGNSGGRESTGGREPGTGGREPSTGGTTGGRDSQSGGAGGESGSATTGGAVTVAGAGAGGVAGEGGEGLGGGGANGIVPCKNPAPWTQDPTGAIVSCGTWKHRPEVAECPSVIPRPDRIEPGPGWDQNLGGGGGASPGCEFDADCDESEACIVNEIGYPHCALTCTTDADCPSNAPLCECNAPAGICRRATCLTDADCENGALCAAELRGEQYGCQTPEDECMVDDDCDGDRLCEIESMIRRCVDPPVPGRPFLVGGEARVAELCERADWCIRTGAAQVSALSLDQRERLAAEWGRVAQMEHASVAAFARFSLELLAFGAPADLVALAAEAQADETAHALAAFELASAYAARPLGPAKLAVTDALTASTLEQSVLSTFLEGCIGESVAALEAALARDAASEPSVKATLERIARDEAKHAELAFKFVRWAMGQTEPSLVETLREALAAEIGRARASLGETPSAHEPALSAHGILPDSERRVARLAALREVVAPCFAALLADVTGAAPDEPLAAVSLDGGIFRGPANPPALTA